MTYAERIGPGGYLLIALVLLLLGIGLLYLFFGVVVPPVILLAEKVFHSVKKRFRPESEPTKDTRAAPRKIAVLSPSSSAGAVRTAGKTEEKTSSRLILYEELPQDVVEALPEEVRAEEEGRANQQYAETITGMEAFHVKGKEEAVIHVETQRDAEYSRSPMMMEADFGPYWDREPHYDTFDYHITTTDKEWIREHLKEASPVESRQEGGTGKSFRDRSDPYLGREEPDVLQWIVVSRSDLPGRLVAGHENLGYGSFQLGLMPDRETLVCGMAYEHYEKEHQPGGLSADSTEWVMNYDYYVVEQREVSSAAVRRLREECGLSRR